MEKTVGFVITAGHLDIEWYQPLRSYRFWTAETFEELKRAAAREDFGCYVLDGQVYPLEEYLEIAPEDESVLREFIKEGKLAIGPFFTQFDEWLPSAESIIRNCLYGRRRAEFFGGVMRAGYLPDNFGHPRQLPQILREFDIDSLLFMRGMPEVPGGHPDEFIYRGLDGSEVLCSHFRESYAGAFDIFHKPIDPIQPRDVPYYDGYLSFEYHRALADHDDPERIARNMIENVRRIRDRYPSRIVPLIAGFDHLPPQAKIGNTVRAANEMQDEIEFRQGDVEQYIRAVTGRTAESGATPTVYDMELLGSRYQYVLLGALSTRSYLKRQNFACEALLERYTEPLLAIARTRGYRFRRTMLDEAWRAMLLCSAHDSIHGSSVDEVHTEMEARYAAVRQIASGLIHEALSYLGERTKRWWQSLPGGRGILAYSPSGGEFPQTAEVWLPVGDAPVQIINARGESLPTQILDRETVERNARGEPRNARFPADVYRKILFAAPFVAGGTASFAAVQGSGGAETGLRSGDDFLENDFLRVEAAAGGLLNLTDKRSGRIYYGLNLLEEEADAGDAWDFSPPWLPGETVLSSQSPFTVRLTEQGPVRCALELAGEMDIPAGLCGDERSAKRVKMPVRFLVSLFAGVPRVDIRLNVTNTAMDHRLRLRVSTGIVTDEILSQGHLAVLKRPLEHSAPTEEWLQPPTNLYPFREWTAAGNDERGLAVAFKGVYDYEASHCPLTRGAELRYTLFRGIGMMGRLNTMQRRGGASDAFLTPGAQCLGEQVIEWSYIPFRTDPGDTAPFLSVVQSFLYPPVTHAIRSEAVAGEELPGPVCSCDSPNIVFSALKPAMEGDAMVLRLYENQGRPTTARLCLRGVRTAWTANMNEEKLGCLELHDGTAVVEFGPYRAVTLILEAE